MAELRIKRQPAADANGEVIVSVIASFLGQHGDEFVEEMNRMWGYINEAAEEAVEASDGMLRLESVEATG